MVYVVCDECGEPMDLVDEDSRQEWYKGYYGCSTCDRKKVHTRYYDQNGLVTSDEVEDDDE